MPVSVKVNLKSFMVYCTTYDDFLVYVSKDKRDYDHLVTVTEASLDDGENLLLSGFGTSMMYGTKLLYCLRC